MPGGDGGSSTLGVSIWADRTNSLVRSQAFDNASWVKGNFSVGNPTIQANACLSPVGDMTGELVTFPAVDHSSPGYSFIQQGGGAIDYDVRTVYVRTMQDDGGAWEAIEVPGWRV